jgi:hypothetical protein
MQWQNLIPLIVHLRSGWLWGERNFDDCRRS